MAQKYDLTDIGNALSRVMDNPMTKIIRSGSIGVLGVVNPVAGIVGGIGNDLLSEWRTILSQHQMEEELYFQKTLQILLLSPPHAIGVYIIESLFLAQQSGVKWKKAFWI